MGRRLVDRLVQVWLPGGQDAWLLIHIEVQSQEERGFAERMFVYFYRIFDRYDREVVSLAVPADERANWHPGTYARSRWGCEVLYRYPLAKLTDWRGRREVLEASDNAFATVVLAHLAAQETRADAPGRERAKLTLIRRLYERGYSRERVLSLLRFVDWLLALPPDLIAAAGQQLPSMSREGLDERNAQHAAKHADCTKRETLELLRENGASVAAAVRALSDEQLGLQAGQFGSVEYVVERILTGHVQGHLQGIQEALTG